MARSPVSSVSNLIAGSQPSKSDFRSVSKLLPNQCLQCAERWWWLAFHPASYVAKVLRHSNILISCRPQNNYAGSNNTNPDAIIVAQGRETRFSTHSQVNSAPHRAFWFNNLKPTLAPRAELRRAHPTRPRRGGPQTGGWLSAGARCQGDQGSCWPGQGNIRSAAVWDRPTPGNDTAQTLVTKP